MHDGICTPRRVMDPVAGVMMRMLKKEHFRVKAPKTNRGMGSPSRNRETPAQTIASGSRWSDTHSLNRKRR
jgi:hypothetical protein